MDTIVLESKLHIPIQRQRIVPRPRLQTALEHQVPHYKLTLVSAPAGYGKTTLLAEWARATKLSVAWLSITGEEDDTESFLRYLLAAWEPIQPELLESPLGILLGSQRPDIKAVFSSFLNAANEIPDHTVFVLDDYHLIEDPGIHDAVTFMLDHLPRTLHFLIAIRSAPLLPLARYRARGQLLEIKADNLHFTRNETADFLKRSMELDLSPDKINSLHADTEGWIAGLQLAALAIRRRSGGAERLRRITGKQRFIAEYLAEDVLGQLQTDIRDFLLRTSLLGSLCGPLCDSVTGQKNGQSMLEALERENLFINPLDDRKEWYRYHQLFAEFLHSELARRHPDEIPGIHRRAGEWYLRHAMPEEAFRHAIAADDAGLVMEIFVKYIGAKLAGGEIKIVTSWIDSIPHKWYTAHPELALARSALLMTTGAFEHATRSIDEIEQNLSLIDIGDRSAYLARASAIRCYMACFQNDLERAETYARLALENLPMEDVSFRFGIYGALGDTYRRKGLWSKAKEWYLKGLHLNQAPEVRAQSTHVFGALADLELWQGHLQTAASYWQKALDFIQERENWGRLPLPLIGWIYIRMGELLYEWDRLEEAWDHISRGLKRAEMGGDVRSLIAGYVIAARLKLAEGDVEMAAKYMEQARPLEEQASFPDWTSQFERAQLELWLAQDKLRTAVKWSDEMSGSVELNGRPESVVTQLAMARVLIIKGDELSIDRSLALLDRLLETAKAEGRMSVTIEALALRALAGWKRGEPGRALVSLERALRLAEPEGYVRLFADLGLPMARILQEARSRELVPDYVEELLAAFRQGISVADHTRMALPDPLTRREQEVLKLISAGLTNQEIAEELVISYETVKKHAGNIYRKLGVGNRTEAVSRARALDLLR